MVAVNGSVRMEKSDTAMLLGPFLEGMEKAGASVELFYVKRLNIRPCIGDFYCWNTKPGECIISDDMQILYPKLRGADILVLATPVYIPLPGEMQNFINRLCPLSPLIEPILEKHEGSTRARFHENVRIRKIVLVSASGWWELGNFGIVLHIAEEIAKKVGVEFAGAVLRPHAFLMRENKEKAEIIKDALKHAGFQLIKDGKMSEDILDKISQPLISEEDLRQRYNEPYMKIKHG
ncbi:MAG: flavodoxin family protein [Candidatus Hadarchaeum sp.]|uniref:flavodoxin family protein n=1 Tax=Candidatus Hadarchaeum sp. TaxID=2883567 RepID=UPI00317B83B3